MKYINVKNGYANENIDEIVQIIQSGGVAILPTDTVYGIACDAFCEDAVKKIYSVKKRKSTNPVNILVSNMEMIEMVSKCITNIEKKIIEKFFPGAITIILDKSNSIKKYVTGGLNTIGVRMPDNKMLLEVIERLRKTYCCNKL